MLRCSYLWHQMQGKTLLLAAVLVPFYCNRKFSYKKTCLDALNKPEARTRAGEVVIYKSTLENDYGASYFVIKIEKSQVIWHADCSPSRVKRILEILISLWKYIQGFSTWSVTRWPKHNKTMTFNFTNMISLFLQLSLQIPRPKINNEITIYQLFIYFIFNFMRFINWKINAQWNFKS